MSDTRSKNSPRVYLDQINGQPLWPEVVQSVEAALKVSANPSALYGEARAAAQSIEAARRQVAKLIGAKPSEIVWTSSGTEANIWGIWGLLLAHEKRGKHVVVSVVEHHSLIQTIRRLEKQGWSVTWVGVDAQGRVDPQAIEAALTDETVLVSLQWANPEVGTLQPIEAVARLLQGKEILLHTDAVAAAGQVPIDVTQVSVDALSLAGNLLGGLPGTGALYLRKGVRILPMFIGGSQEEGRRAGTPNQLGAVALGAAAHRAGQELPGLASRLTPLRERLVRGILDLHPEAVIQGDPALRLPGHVSVSFPGLDAERLTLALDINGLAVGIGSACSAQTMKASHVLKAMGVEDRQALGTITCTLSPQTTEAQVDQALKILGQTVTQLSGNKPSEAFTNS